MLLIWCLASIGGVLALRFVDPPVTSVMLLEPGAAKDIDYRWVGAEGISIHAARAVIASEDQRFLEHHGLDFNQIDEAIEDWQRGDELRGASTITQQVAKNVFLWNGRSLLRKGMEAWFALLIDTLCSKRRTMELYLNIAEFGPNVFGIEAAAQRYFNRSAAELSAAEASRLAAVLPSPKRMSVTLPDEYVLLRQREIMAQISLLEERGHFRELDW